MGEQQQRDSDSTLPKVGYHRATSQQLRVTRQLLDQISGDLRRADKSATEVEFVLGQLPIAIANITNRIQELEGGTQERTVPTKDQARQTELAHREPRKVPPSRSQEDMDLER